MKRMYLAAAVALVLISWMLPYRFTPTSAVQAGMTFKVRPLLAERFPGGAAVLTEHADGSGHELTMVRRWGPFYRAMSSATLYPPLNGDRLSTSVNELTANGAVAFGGMVFDEHVARITAGGQEQSVHGQRYYLFVWAPGDRTVWHDARAYDETGAVRYELNGLQWKAK